MDSNGMLSTVLSAFHTYFEGLNIELEKISDAIRKMLIDEELTPIDQKALFSDDRGFSNGGVLIR